MKRMLPLLLLAAVVTPVPAAEPGVPQPIPLLDGEPQRGCWIALSGETTPGGASRYEWQQTAGPAVRFFDQQRFQARVWTFLEEAGSYRFTLRAENVHGWSAEAPLEFEVPAKAPFIPIEEAYLPVGAGEEVRLPGEAWKQLYGNPIRLTETPDRRFTTFRILQTGLFVFEAWRAGDMPERRGIWLPPGLDEVMGDRRPVAVLPPTLSGRAGQPVHLDASLSYDRDGPTETLTARWNADMVHGATLAVTGPLKATFVAPHEGIYKLELLVTDGKLDSLPERRFIQVVGAQAPQPAESLVPGQLSDDPLDQRVNLRLHEATLDDAVQRFPSRCKVALRVDPAFMPPERLRSIRLELGAQRATIRLLCNWIARQSDAWYQIEENGSIWFTSPTAWAAGDQTMESLLMPVDALHDDKEASDLMVILQRTLDGVMRECTDARLVYQPEKDQVLAVLPRRAADRLRDILGHLRAPKGLGLAPPAEPLPAERALRQTLATETLTYRWESRRLDLLLRDFEEQSGVPCGLDPRNFPKGLPKITLNVQDAVLRQVVRDIVEAAGLDGCSIDPLGALWFYRGNEPCPSRELLWDRARVQTFDLEPILSRIPILSGEAVAHLVRQRVFADSWNVPGTCCLFHRPTGKLVVVHVPEAQDRVLRVLWDFLIRGEGAMGPVLSPEESR